MVDISINQHKCTKCGICRIQCPACFTSAEDRVVIRDNAKRCIACGHCVALCPADAIKHQYLPAHRFSLRPAFSEVIARGFEDLVRVRRSHRHFEQRPISDDILSKILDCCRFSPTGVNAQEVCVKVVRTPNRVRRIARLTVNHFVEAVERLAQEMAALEAAHKPIPESLRRAYNRNARYGQMGVSFEKGFDPVFHNAPVVLMFHAPTSSPTPKDDCIIAAHTVVLYAELLGLGSCYIGLFTRAATESSDILKALELPVEHRIYTTLILGYPALKFLKIPPRAPFRITWE